MIAGSNPVAPAKLKTMLCLETFTEKYADDFLSWEEWVEFVNKNMNYAKIKSQAFDFRGIVKETQVPSFHPFWSNKVKQNRVQDLIVLRERYAECKTNPDKIKYYFNLTTTLENIKGYVDKAERDSAGVLYE